MAFHNCNDITVSILLEKLRGLMNYCCLEEILKSRSRTISKRKEILKYLMMAREYTC